MTSEERRAGRAQRRREAREAPQRERLSEYDNFERVADYNSLYQAYKDARKGVGWKASVQRYRSELSKNLCKTHNALINGEDVRKGFIAFDLVERVFADTGRDKNGKFIFLPLCRRRGNEGQRPQAERGPCEKGDQGSAPPVP